MKKLFVTLAAFFIVVSANAQSATSIEPILLQGYAFVKEIEKEYGSSAIITKAEFDFAMDDNLTIYEMTSGLTYVLGAMGDANVEDIGLIVYKKVDGQWVKLQDEEKHSNSAVLTVKPETSGEYAIDVKVNKFKTKDNIGHVALFIIATK